MRPKKEEEEEKKEKSFTMHNMAAWLNIRKDAGTPTVLLLGSRAGGLFRSEIFFRELGKVSSRDLNLYPRTKPFSECYFILANGGFSETDIHSIFHASFKKLSPIKVDIYLAELVKQGYFVEIISTNIDDLLEASFTEAGMREHAHFEVISSHADLPSASSLPIKMYKAFGDFSARNYTLNRYLSSVDGRQEYMNALRRVLAKDILLFGIDPTWDKDILDAIPLHDAPPDIPKPGTVWLVSEEDLTKDAAISDILSQRQHQSIIGREGEPDRFFISLYHHLNTDVPFNYQVVPNITTRLDEVSDRLTSTSHQLAEILQNVQDVHEKVLGLQDSHREILDEVKDIQNKVDKFLQGGEQ